MRAPFGRSGGRGRSVLPLVFMAMLAADGAAVFAQQPELRGVWMTPRSGSGFWSKAEIARAMDSVANNNFNVVYFNAWSRGWPLFRSRVFHEETGFYTDPAAGERDILQEAIAEAHRRGLELEAWMEYGFVSWWSGNSLPGYPRGPILAKYPHWAARDKSGSDQFTSGHVGNFYWLAHSNPDVQQYLIRLHREIAERYDVDGIELDRIRYPQLDCGYDSVTSALYRAATGGNPPVTVNDPGWMRWRADRINEFHRAAYDSIKASSPTVIVANAPSHYSAGTNYPAYESFLQDWRQWLNTGAVDALQIQMYVQPSLLQNYIPSALNGVNADVRSRAYAGVAPVTTNYVLSDAEAVQLVTVTRDAGMQGMAFWYYNDLRDSGYFPPLKAGPFLTEVSTPYRSPGWRPDPVILDETSASQAGSWTAVTLPAGSPIDAWSKSLLYADSTGVKAVQYAFDVPQSAYYEVYAYQVGGLLNTTSSAPYEVTDADGRRDTVVVDQANPANGGWHKLGDLFLRTGEDVPVVRLTNERIGQGKFVVADAVMLVLNRRLSPGASTDVRGDAGTLPALPVLDAAYPNPFNGETRIGYVVPRTMMLSIDVYDTLGRLVERIARGEHQPGRHAVAFSSQGRSSGIYFVRMTAGSFSSTRKIALLR